MRFNLSLKILSTVFFISLLLFGALSFFLITQFQDYMETSYVERGRSTALSLDAGADSALLESEQRLSSFLNKHLFLDPSTVNMEAIIVEDGIYAQYTKQGKKESTSEPADYVRASYEGDQFQHMIFTKDDERVLRVVNPIHVSGQVRGVFLIDLSLASLDREIASMIRTLIIIYVVAMAFFIGVVFLILNRIIIAPLLKLKAAFGEMMNGNFKCMISVNSKDEMGDLASAFNQMLEIMDATRRQVGEVSEKLEQQSKRK
jgi:nitrate/nitrite-specific signal transduction histidine kinase